MWLRYIKFNLYDKRWALFLWCWDNSLINSFTVSVWCVSDLCCPKYQWEGCDNKHTSNLTWLFLGTDEKSIIGVICKRSTEQRLELVKTYREVYGKDLKKELHGELSGNFRDLILGLCVPAVDFDAEQLRKAMKVCSFIWNKCIFKC